MQIQQESVRGHAFCSVLGSEDFRTSGDVCSVAQLVPAEFREDEANKGGDDGIFFNWGRHSPPGGRSLACCSEDGVIVKIHVGFSCPRDQQSS